jgi:hypothetical protein
MTDVLKLAEEALSSAIESHYAWSNRSGYLDIETYTTLQENSKLIRAARAECGWRPIAEMERLETYEVACGAYTITGEWVVMRFQTANAAIGLGYTHFYRPQLPPPPTREEVGNG